MKSVEIYTKYSEKLKQIIRKNKDNNFEKTFAAISAYADLAYNWNQFYSDFEIEDLICKLSDKIYSKDCCYCKFNKLANDEYKADDNTVLFYDCFGLDTRGLAAIYAKALVSLNYKVIWVTTDKAIGKIPTIEKFLGKGNVVKVFIDMSYSYKKHIEQLSEAFEMYAPKRAFFYTKPNDVCAEIVFYHYKNKVTRYQINLTDHAFWLGNNAFDYCLEFREYGAGLSRIERKIDESKIVLLPYYPLIDTSVEYQGLPFDKTGKKVLFSGGSLYKTIGGDNKFYKIVAKVLEDNADTVFLYAGSGDDSELVKLSEKFVGRVYHIQERKDLFALMIHVDAYLNTYPMIGGLMSQYAAMAGLPPIILIDKGETDSSGIILEQEKANIEFHKVEDVVNELNHLLQDFDYRKQRAEDIKKRVISESDFTSKLSDIMVGKAKTCKVDCPDTMWFRKDYISRFKFNMVLSAIASRKNKSLMFNFIDLFALQVAKKVVKNLVKR